MPEFHRAFEAAMLQWVTQVSILGANPVNAFAVGIRLGWRLLGGGFANRIDLLDRHPFLLKLVLGLVLAQPAHLLGDFLLGFLRVAVFIPQFHVFVRPCVALLHELLVIMLVSSLLGFFLAA